MLKHFYAGTYINNAVEMVTEKGFSAHAQIGEVDTIRVVVDDPDSTLSFVGWKPWLITETSAPAGQQAAWYGFTGDQIISRGDDDVRFPTTTGRRWYLTLQECNGFMARRVLWAVTPRPAETVSARITWLLAQAGFTSIIIDHGLIEADTTAMDPFDYNGHYGADVLRDCSLVSGKNFFVRYREASSDLELAFYNARTSALDTSTLRISNVLADVDLATTWPPNPGAQLTRGASRIAGGIYLPFNGGAFFGNNPSVETTFGPIDQIAPAASVSTYAAASPLVNRLLLQHGTQEERIACKIELPAENLNDVKQGQQIYAKFSHLPGWTTSRPCRVAVKSFSRPTNLTEARYDVDLELTPACPTATLIQQGDIIPKPLSEANWYLPFTPIAGDLLVALLGYGGNTTPVVAPTGWTVAGYQEVFTRGRSGVIYKVSDGTEYEIDMSASGVSGSNQWYGHIYEFSGAGAVTAATAGWTVGGNNCTTPSTQTAPSITAAAGDVVLGILGVHNDAPGGGCNDFNYTAVAPWTLDSQQQVGNFTSSPKQAYVRQMNVTAGAKTPQATWSQTPKEYGHMSILVASSGGDC